MREPWKFCIEERIRWGDVDAARIIFYGSYIRFFEYAETELFRSAGLSYAVMFDELDIWLPRAHIECDFYQPAQLDDLLEVCVFVSRIGTKSITLQFEVKKKGEPTLIADARFVLVAVRRATFETVSLPRQLLEKLHAYTDPKAGQASEGSATDEHR